jgi:acyl-CoA synthetase (AMP-forming)/AMP-acid ligase II
MDLSLTLQTVAKVHPDRPAIVWGGGELGYGAFEAQVQRIAGALRRRHGLEPGARVALAME